MELENKIKCVLMDFEINEITLQEATKRILLLLEVGQLSCGRNVTTCLFYKERGKCSNLEYCINQTT